MDPCLTHIKYDHHHLKCPSQPLDNIKEEEEYDDAPTCRLPSKLHPPETPTEAMEFLARSWSLSAVELSKALDTQDTRKPPPLVITPPISPRDSKRGKTKGRHHGWLKDHKEKRRAREAQSYAAASVAGVAASVATFASNSAFPRGEKLAAAVASATMLVASHCIEMARIMGAGRDQILTAVRSAVDAETAGNFLTLTASAATALRGAAILNARIHKDVRGAAFTIGDNKKLDGCSALAFVSNGGELLKRTRNGILHWKQVSVYINSSWQLVVKMKSTHIAGTFVKTKKGVVTDVCSDVSAWPGRESDGQRAYFGIKTTQRVIEFECRNKFDKQEWIEGIRQMLSGRNSLM